MRALKGLAILVGVLACCLAQAEEVPTHVLLARDIVQNIKQENNAHVLDNRHVDLPTDWTLFGKKNYVVHTDCIGFIEAIIERAYGKMPAPATKKYKTRYSIIDYVDSADSGYIMQKVGSFNDVKVGDLLMWKYITRKEGQTTNGHIVLVNGTPTKMPKSRIKGTTMWEVEVIDDNTAPISFEDTRFYGKAPVSEDEAEEALKQLKDGTLAANSGAGRGHMYFFTDDAGQLVAASYGYPRSRIQRQDTNWHMVMVRMPQN